MLPQVGDRIGWNPEWARIAEQRGHSCYGLIPEGDSFPVTEVYEDTGGRDRWVVRAGQAFDDWVFILLPNRTLVHWSVKPDEVPEGVWPFLIYRNGQLLKTEGESIPSRQNSENICPNCGTKGEWIACAMKCPKCWRVW